MRVSKGAKKRAAKPAVRHEFPRCIIKAYARARQRAVALLDPALTLRGPTAAAIEASERQYLREGSVR